MDEHNDVYDLTAEREVLGALLQRNNSLFEIPFLSAKHFYEPVHQRIFEDIEQRMIAGEPATLTTMRDKFNRDEALVGLGGIGYLAKLMVSGVGVLNPIPAAKIVLEAWKKQNMIGAVQTIIEQANLYTAEELASAAYAALDAAIDRTPGRFTSKEVTLRILDSKKNNVQPFSTGIAALDECMGGGLFPRKSYGFAARKKVGKTILAATLSYNLAQQGIKHLFIAGEMGSDEIQERILARSINEYPATLRASGDTNVLQKISNAAAADNGFMIYQDAPGLTFDDLKRYISAAIHKDNITGFILDYWQLVGGKPKNKSTAEHLDEVAQWVSDFCRQKGLWSITFAQINQEGNTRGSEGLRLAFDQVYTLNRENGCLEGWIGMLETRYTQWKDIGSENSPGIVLRERGLYFDELK
jgi:replicative DNA helicase